MLSRFLVTRTMLLLLVLTIFSRPSTLWHSLLGLGAPGGMLDSASATTLAAMEADFQRHQTTPTKSASLSVMSFNIPMGDISTLSGTTFARRVPHLTSVLRKWSPDVVGLQEFHGPQLADWMDHANSLEVEDKNEDQESGDSDYSSFSATSSSQPQYAALGYNRPGIPPHDIRHARRVRDFGTAIIYRTDRLKLLEQHFVATPSTPEPMNLDPTHIRTLNIARFRLRVRGDEKSNEDEDEVVIFNTHYDVSSEEARRKHSIVIRAEMLRWRDKFPKALLILTGDFNAVPGQMSHRTLLNNFHDTPARSPKLLELHDTWEWCRGEGLQEISEQLLASAEVCNSVPWDAPAMTFHLWVGTWLDLRVIRWLAPWAFSLHAMQVDLPRGPVSKFWEILRAIKVACLSFPGRFQFSESFPSGFWDAVTRYHVDWILFSSPRGMTPSHESHDDSQAIWAPQLITVAEVENEHFISDHFPVVAMFHRVQST